VWALGAIFFLLLTGEPLIKVDEPLNPSEEMRRVLQGQEARRVLDPSYIRLRVQSVAARLPPGVGELLSDMLRQDPARRITIEEALQHPFLAAGSPA